MGGGAGGVGVGGVVEEELEGGVVVGAAEVGEGGELVVAGAGAAGGADELGALEVAKQLGDEVGGEQVVGDEDLGEGGLGLAEQLVPATECVVGEEVASAGEGEEGVILGGGHGDRRGGGVRESVVRGYDPFPLKCPPAHEEEP